MVVYLQSVGSPFATSSPHTSLPKHVHRETPCASIHTYALADSADSSRRQACQPSMTPNTSELIHICSRPREPAQPRSLPRHRVATVVSTSSSLENYTALLCAKRSPMTRLSPRPKLRSVCCPDPASHPPRRCPGPRRICPRTASSTASEGGLPGVLGPFCDPSGSLTSMSAPSPPYMLPFHPAPALAPCSSFGSPTPLSEEPGISMQSSPLPDEPLLSYKRKACRSGGATTSTGVAMVAVRWLHPGNSVAVASR